jgi:hypothetical protein
MLLDHPQSPPRALAPALHSPIVELRQYTLHPGQRDTLIELFEREFLDTQAEAGIAVLGQFRDLDADDRFVWSARVPGHGAPPGIAAAFLLAARRGRRIAMRPMPR